MISRILIFTSAVPFFLLELWDARSANITSSKRLGAWIAVVVRRVKIRSAQGARIDGELLLFSGPTSCSGAQLFRNVKERVD